MSETRELDDVFDELPPNVQQELQALEEIVYQQKRRITKLEEERHPHFPKWCEELQAKVDHLEAWVEAKCDEVANLELKVVVLKEENARYRMSMPMLELQYITAERDRLREAAGELVANAEWDGDISTVDTGDLKALRAELLQEPPTHYLRGEYEY